MLPLIGGLILLLIAVFALWVFLAPIYNWLGSKIQTKIEFFKNKGENAQDEKKHVRVK
jgi:uncharacterized membrane protein YdjX (TVP38/TMEM64 family)